MLDGDHLERHARRRARDGGRVHVRHHLRREREERGGVVHFIRYRFQAARLALRRLVAERVARPSAVALVDDWEKEETNGKGDMENYLHAEVLVLRAANVRKGGETETETGRRLRRIRCDDGGGTKIHLQLTLISYGGAS